MKLKYKLEDKCLQSIMGEKPTLKETLKKVHIHFTFLMIYLKSGYQKSQSECDHVHELYELHCLVGIAFV